MKASDLGYNKDLFILPFDHRSSFEAGLLGIRGRQAEPGEVEKLTAYKRVIYEGFLEALDQGVPVETAAILVDQKYGEELLADANKREITTCTSVEKSGQPEFDFEYGDDFGRHLREASPTFAKVLVRYNPDGDAQMNETQRLRLKVLSDHAHSAGYKFMFELEAWRIVGPLLQGQENPGMPPPQEYEPGSWGPPAADELLSQGGHIWQRVCGVHGGGNG